MQTTWFLFVSFAIASAVAAATGDQDAARLIWIAFIGACVAVLAICAVLAPELYRDVWRMMQPDRLAPALDRFAIRASRRGAVDTIRRELTALGYPSVLSMTDEEIEASALSLQQVMWSTGATVAEAERAFLILAGARPNAEE